MFSSGGILVERMLYTATHGLLVVAAGFAMCQCSQGTYDQTVSLAYSDE